MYYDQHDRMFSKYISWTIFLLAHHVLQLRYACCSEKEKSDSDFPISVMSSFKILFKMCPPRVVCVCVGFFRMFVVILGFFINNKTVFWDVMDKVDWNMFCVINAVCTRAGQMGFFVSFPGHNIAIHYFFILYFYEQHYCTIVYT